MANIDDIPAGVTDAGQDHNYTGPGPVQIVLVSAPVDPDHTVVGVDRGAYDTFIDAEIAAGRAWVRTIQHLDPRRPLHLALDYNDASEYNYVRLTIDSRPWYLFVTELEYGSPNGTRLITEIDPFPTYTWNLGHSLIERGHAAVAASQNDTYGDQFCEAPEPIDAPPALGRITETALDLERDEWTLIVISANDLRGRGTATPYFEHHVAEADIADTAENAWLAGLGPSDPGGDYLPVGGGDHGATIESYRTPYPWHDDGFSTYYVPTVKASPVSRIDGVTQGGGAYLFKPSAFASWLTAMQGAPWVLEGITDIRMVPSWAVEGGNTNDGPAVGDSPPTSPIAAAWLAVATLPEYRANVTTMPWDGTVLAGWRDDYLTSLGASKFRKLVTAAFTRIVVGTGESETEYDPDLMRTSGVNLHARTGMAHGERSIRVTADYNTMTDQNATTIVAGGSPGIVASGYGRAASDTASAILGPTNASFTSLINRRVMDYNRDLALDLGESQIPMNMGIIGVQSVMNAAGGAALAGLAGAGPAGAVAGAVVGGGAALVTAGLSANNSLDMLDASKAGSIDIGSFQLGGNGIFNAITFRTWVQSLRARSGSGQAGGLAAAWRHLTGQALRVTIVGPAPDRAAALISRWERYGYMIGRAFRPSRLDVMTRFSYWQTSGAVVTGQIPNTHRTRVASAFDRGVTVYRNLSDIGVDVSASNNPVPGISY